jgi:DNA mismatch endonuclease, patch repair protein
MIGNRAESQVERALRSGLHRKGRRFRKHYRPLRDLRCSADLAFTRQRLAVFVDGCFWHRCPDHKPAPKANAKWWEAKLAANVARDRRNDSALTAAGWRVLRLWTHLSLDEMMAAVEGALSSASDGSR